MKINKGMSVLLASMLIGGMLVGCSSEFDSTEYLDEQGKEIIEKYENREKYNYIKVEELNYLNRYEDEYIMITGKVTSISEEGLACYELGFDFEENHTTEPIRVFVQKNMIDVKFNKGDIITVYGKCYGIKTKRYDDKSIDYWHIFANFLELGDTTNEEKSTKKDDVEAKATEDKEVEDKEVETAKDKEEEKYPSQDNNKSNEKQVNTKKDNTDTTAKKDTKKEKPKKEEPKKKGYYVTCPNGHKIYTENGDWDCIECDDDWQEQEEADDSDYEYEDGYIKDGTHLGENNPDESIEVIEDPEYYE